MGFSLGPFAPHIWVQVGFLIFGEMGKGITVAPPRLLLHSHFLKFFCKGTKLPLLPLLNPFPLPSSLTWLQWNHDFVVFRTQLYYDFVLHLAQTKTESHFYRSIRVAKNKMKIHIHCIKYTIKMYFCCSILKWKKIKMKLLFCNNRNVFALIFFISQILQWKYVFIV